MRKTKFTIFFSWQSDIKGNTKIIRDALNAECQRQKENGNQVKVDESTRNLPGSPKIEDSVLDKISHSDIFVCDITPVTNVGGKEYPNSNVIFELGYAFHALGEKRIIMLAKGGSCDMKNMPFDFNHRRIGIFHSAKDCDLKFEIGSCIKECKEHPRTIPFIDKIRYAVSSIYIRRTTDSANIPSKKAETKIKATEESTVFFTRRMAMAFPGLRGVKEISNISDIKSDLKVLLQKPLDFSHGLEGADTDPIWWFRGGSGMPIKSFSTLPFHRRKILLDNDELLIKRIIVYRDNGRYYKQYVYVETYPDKPTGLSDINQDLIDEEYADFNPSWYLPTRHISRQDYDDGSTTVWGRHVNLKSRAQLRIRHLAPYNFIICAKFSPYNSREFCTTSEPYFKGMLDGSVSFNAFHTFMMSFQRKSY